MSGDEPTEPRGDSAGDPTEPGVSGEEPIGPHAAEEGTETGGAPAPAPFGQPGAPLARSPFVVGFTAGLGLVLAYVCYLAVRNAFSILVLILVALFLAIGLNPAVVRLNRLGLPRGLAVAVVALGVVILACGGLLALIPPLIRQGNALIHNLPDYIESLRGNRTLRRLDEQYEIFDRLQSAATPQNVTRALGGVWGGAQFVFGAVFNVLTVGLLTVYFMAAFERLKAGAYRLVPASRRERVQLLGDEILTKVGAYIGGALAIAFVAGVSTLVLLLIAGVAYPGALAVVVAVTDLIPQIGATLGAVVVSTFGFLTSIPVGIACVVFFIVYQQVENWLIYPKVMRRAVKVSDLSAILGALLGFSLLGFVGALITIPAVAAVQLIFREVVVPRQQRH